MAAPFETLASGYHSLEAPNDQRLSIAISGNDVVSRLNDWFYIQNSDSIDNVAADRDPGRV
jgi:hypothetical protein